MKVLIVADVHLDLWQSEGRDPFAALTSQDWSGLDALFIAGDLTNKPRVRWKNALRHLSHYVALERIVIIPGNHDYYDFRLDGDDRLAGIAADEGAQFAQKAEIVIGTTRFLCCTIWTDFALHGDISGSQSIARARMNDYRYVRNAQAGFRKIRPYETALIHHDHRSWLEGRLSQLHPGKTIVITHHCPHPELISAAPSDLDPAYGSDLTGLIARHQPDGWFFGHTHHHAETFVGRTLIRNVSLGYPEQVGFADERDVVLRGLIDISHPEFPLKFVVFL